MKFFLQYTFLLFCFFYFFTWASASNDEGSLDIGSFNVQVFGLTKMKKALVQKYLTEIVLRYDLVLIQEIRDSSGTAITELLSNVQRVDPRYAMALSNRLGRTTSKEQYAFIYRIDWLTYEGSYTYSDPNDVFEREPFIARFASNRASIAQFAVAALHSSPGDAENEINHMVDVYDDITKRWGLYDVMLMGDFNADCSYTQDWDKIKLATDTRFYWLIDNSVDTTTKSTDCAYDRIVAAGTNLLDSIIPFSAGAFNFGQEYGLTQSEVEQISDHYPVQVQISSSAEKKNLIKTRSSTLYDKTLNHLTSSQIYAMRKRVESDMPTYKLGYSYTKSGAYLLIRVWKTVEGQLEARKALTALPKDFPGFVTNTEVYASLRMINDMSMLKFLPRGHGMYQTLYDVYKHIKYSYALALECSLKDRSKPVCNVKITQML